MYADVAANQCVFRGCLDVYAHVNGMFIVCFFFGVAMGAVVFCFLCLVGCFSLSCVCVCFVFLCFC